MSTLNNVCFHRVRPKQLTDSKILNALHKLLVVACVYLVFGLLFHHVYASIEDGNIDNNNPDPYQTQRGSVWLLPDDGVYIEVLQMQTDVDYDITGGIARAKVRQQFVNSSSLWAEGIYVFPLPEKAAVDHFRMIIGERIIEGQVKERNMAKKIYQKAKSNGQKASLIEQQRPNVFTTSLANIAPGEIITIEFEFQQVLDYRDKQYRLRFPMVVGPRYHTAGGATQNMTGLAAESRSVYTETDSKKNTNNPVRIHILLDAGVSLYDLNSTYHPIDIKQTSETRYSISTVGENISSGRDFELVWQPQLNSSPQISAFSEDSGEENHTMLTLLPPDLTHLQQKVQARDVVFVLDISGSMSGTSITQAKASLITALDGLSSIDRFNVIWFNDKSDQLFSKEVAATSQNKNTAKRFIDGLEAGGGTEMLPALKMALSEQKEFSRFRQVIFLTDGNISNEAELFDVIDRQLVDNRLFTIGIGSAPNAYFMRKAANKGRGTFTYIGDVDEVQNKTLKLLKKLETPALINIQLDLDRDKYEVFPNIIPDLYAGETATILIKGEQLPEHITIKGDYGNNEWQTDAELTSTRQNGIRVAWAREKISSLMSLQHVSSADNVREAIKQEVIDTALQHHLVSRYTSLVAVDVTPVNLTEILYQQRMKNNLPHGWKKQDISNGLMLAQTAAGTGFNLLMSFLLFIAAVFIHQFYPESFIRQYFKRTTGININHGITP